MVRLAAAQRRRRRLPAGRFFEWKAVLHDGGNLGSVGVNYLPVNSAPVVDELVVVPGRAHQSAEPGPEPARRAPQTVNIVFPSANQSHRQLRRQRSATPLQAIKDRTAITVRWAAHDDNGDDLIFALYLRGDGETVWRLLKDQVHRKGLQL